MVLVLVRSGKSEVWWGWLGLQLWVDERSSFEENIINLFVSQDLQPEETTSTKLAHTKTNTSLSSGELPCSRKTGGRAESLARSWPPRPGASEFAAVPRRDPVDELWTSSRRRARIPMTHGLVGVF